VGRRASEACDGPDRDLGLKGACLHADVCVCGCERRVCLREHIIISAAVDVRAHAPRYQ